MSMIREKLEQITRDDIMRFVALYSVAAFLVLFLVCPLCILFAKAFQYKDGSFAGFAQFTKYFSSNAMVYSISNTFFIAVVSTIIAVTLAFLFALFIVTEKCTNERIFSQCRYGASFCSHYAVGDCIDLFIWQ